MNTLLLAFVLVAIYLFYHLYYKRRNWPPGPTPIPVLGNLLPVVAGLEKAFVKWRKEYGPIYTFWLGSQPMVVIADYASMVEMLQKDPNSYSDRYYMELFNLVRGGNYGVITTAGDLWRDQRRFAIHVFRDFGLGKGEMEEMILKEVDSLLRCLDTQIVENDNNEIDLPKHIDVAVGSIINAIMFGYRFDESNVVEFYALKRLVNHQLDGSWPILLMMNNPELFKHLPFFKTELKNYITGFNQILNFFDERIAEHQCQMDKLGEQGWRKQPVTDYVFAFLKEKGERDWNGEKHTFSTAQLKNMCLDLWLAGQETTSNTLAWGIALLLHNPSVLTQMHKEMNSVFGNDPRMVTFADRSQMPFTCAVVNETLRRANILVNAIVSNKTTREVVVNGVRIPKGSPVLAQVSAVNYDERVFENPREFNPERFLNKNGSLKKIDAFAPFSVGKRQCLGEALARGELFLFLANLVKRYNIECSAKKPSLRRKMGVTVQCPPFHCKLQKRHQ